MNTPYGPGVTGDDSDMQPADTSTVKEWVLFCKRTEDPKLAWIERELDKLGIAHRRNGESRDAPILQVDAAKEVEAHSILMRRVGRYTIDDIRDNHPRWEDGR